MLSLVNFDDDENTPQAIILSPTREVAMATATLVTSLGLHLGARVNAVVGGMGMIEHNIRELQERRPHILCATTGRLMDLIERNLVQTGSISTLVIDELDTVISAGFEEMIEDVLARLRPNNVQLILSTSTADGNVAQFIDRHLVDGERFARLPPVMAMFQNVSHYRVDCEEAFKLDTLVDLLVMIEANRVIVHCNSQQTVVAIGEYLAQRDFVGVALIHGDVRMADRLSIYNRGRYEIMRIITSIPLERIGRESPPASQFTVNYDMPYTPEEYAARVGGQDQRSTRNLRRMLAISFVSPAEIPRLTAIETRYQITAPELPMDFQDIVLTI